MEGRVCEWTAVPTEALGGGSNHAFLCALNDGENIVFVGSATVHVLRGSIEINGAIIGAGTQWSDIHVAAATWMHLYLGRGIKFHGQNTSMPGPAWCQGVEHESPTTAAYPVVLGIISAKAAEDTVVLLPCDISPERHLLSISDEWRNLGSTLVENIEKSQDNRLVVLIMGPKGVGKSTLSSYLLNRFLSVATKVAYLETDLGQPTFSVPGMISAHVLDRPLAQLSHTNVGKRWPFTAYCAGGVTPSLNPELYLKCVLRCMKEFMSSSEVVGAGKSMPMVVNTHGWVTGLGLNLVEVAAAVSSTTAVVCIPPDTPSPSSTSGNPFENLVRKFCGGSIEGWKNKSHSLYRISPCLPKSQHPRLRPTPAELRWLRIVSYLNPALCAAPDVPRSFLEHPLVPPSVLLTAEGGAWEANPSSNLNRAAGPARYCINLDRIQMATVHGKVGVFKPHHFPAAVTGSTVYLCYDDRKPHLGNALVASLPTATQRNKVEGSPNVRSLQNGRGSDTLDAWSCIALAYVHTVDISARIVVVLTSPCVSMATLKKVNTMFVGEACMLNPVAPVNITRYCDALKLYQLADPGVDSKSPRWVTQRPMLAGRHSGSQVQSGRHNLERRRTPPAE